MPKASFTFYPKRTRMLTTPDPWYKQLSYYVRMRDCGPAGRVPDTGAEDKLYIIEFRPVLQESQETSREATVTITDLRAENLAPQQQPGVSVHNGKLSFQDDGNGRAMLRGFVVRDTDPVRITFERECQTPSVCEWAARPSDRSRQVPGSAFAGRRGSTDIGLASPRQSNQSEDESVTTGGLEGAPEPGGSKVPNAALALERRPSQLSWAPPPSFV